MPVTVQIPSALRPQVNNQETVDVEGQTVSDLLGKLNTDYPEFGQRLFQADGDTLKLNRFINVYVNDEDIRFMDNLETNVSAGDEVAIVPAIAGG